MKNVSIVIPVYITKNNIFQLTNKCLSGITTSHGINQCEVILVDDGSDQKYIGFLKKIYPFVKFIHNDKNLGFAAAVNAGIKSAKYDSILLLNNDVEILNSEWLVRLVNATNEFGWDISSPKQSWLNEQYEYVPDANRHKYKEEKCFCYPVGWCVLVKKSVFEKIGIFPTDFGVGFWEDTAWAYEAKKYFKIGIVDGLNGKYLLHKEHQTFKAENINILEQYKKNREIFLKFIKGDLTLNFPKL
mgnify:FL=1